MHQIIYVISEENKLLPPYPPHLKNVITLPCKMQNFFIWLKVMLHSSKRCWLSEEPVVDWHWWLWKELVVMCGNWNVRQATSQQVFKVTTFCMDICFQSFSPLINCIVHHAMLKFSPCCNKTLPLTRPYRGLVLEIRALAACPRCGNLLVDARTVNWPHVKTGELGCLTAQKLDCVTSKMYWRIVLLEHKTRLQQCCGSLVASSLCISNMSR